MEIDGGFQIVIYRVYQMCAHVDSEGPLRGVERGLKIASFKTQRHKTSIFPRSIAAEK